MQLSVKFYQVNKPTRDAVLEISDESESKVNEILAAGLWFEGEYGGMIGVTTTITGHEADYACVISRDPGDRPGHVLKVEEMIAKFDISKAVEQERAA